jgi:hypothetical protein
LEGYGMSGWYVRELLLNREVIRSELFSSDGTNDFVDDYTEVPYVEDENCFDILSGSFDIDTYDDLLTIESQLKKLIESGEIKDIYIEIFQSVLEERDSSKIMDKYGISSWTIANILDRICGRIADDLGDYFTDEGYIEMLKNKYKLTEEQIKRVRKSMRRGKRFI